MTLEDQVTSLELSRKLKELGVKQESIHYWGIIAGGNPGVWCRHVIQQMDERETRFTWISAFTVAELGEILPINIEGKNSDGNERLFYFESWVGNGRRWYSSYNYYENMEVEKTRIEYLNGKESIDADTEANARAKMLIYLLENKLIKI